MSALPSEQPGQTLWFYALGKQKSTAGVGVCYGFAGGVLRLFPRTLGLSCVAASVIYAFVFGMVQVRLTLAKSPDARSYGQFTTVALVAGGIAIYGMKAARSYWKWRAQS